MRIVVNIPGLPPSGLTVTASVLLQAQEAMASGTPQRRVGLVVLGLAVDHRTVSAALSERGWAGAAPVALDALCARMDADPAGVLVYADAVAAACTNPVRAPVAVAVPEPPSTAGPFGRLDAAEKEAIVQAALKGG